MKIHHYDQNTGEYLGEGVADADPLDAANWLIPANATTTKPPASKTGKTRHFVDGAWAYQDTPPPPPEPVPYEPSREQVIRARLSQIDADSIRPARAIATALAAGKPIPAFDADKLGQLEAEAVALRQELESA